MPLLVPDSPSFMSRGYSPAGAYSDFGRAAYVESAPAFAGSGVAAQLQAELDNVTLDCCYPGWDGYGAEPVSAAAYTAAQRFIRCLPAGFPVPELAADPDGCINFEWHVSARRTFVVSVSPHFQVDFAALFGAAKIHGSEPFFSSELPVSVRDLVCRVYAV